MHICLFLKISLHLKNYICFNICLTHQCYLLFPFRIKCQACRRRSRRNSHSLHSHQTSDTGSPGQHRRSERFHQPIRRGSASSTTECRAIPSSSTSQNTPRRTSHYETDTPGKTCVAAGGAKPGETCNIFPRYDTTSASG